jgi:hypothetical protein
VCAVLTPLARYAYDGPTPLFLFDANTRAAGKSLLADLVATVVTGTDFARTTYAADKAEVRKVITSFVMAGDPLVLFDNVTGRFGDAALTGTRWKDRVLGVSQMYDGPLTAVFYATANNCDVGGGRTKEDALLGTDRVVAVGTRSAGVRGRRHPAGEAEDPRLQRVGRVWEGLGRTRGTTGGW